MARRDQPRADRQCRTIRVSTIAVSDQADEAACRVEGVPGGPGAVADEQHVGRAFGGAAAEGGIPEQHRGNAEADDLRVVGDDHAALEPRPEPPGGPGQTQVGHGGGVNTLGQVPERERDRIRQVDQDVRQQVQVAGDGEQQAQPTGRPPQPGGYPGHQE